MTTDVDRGEVLEAIRSYLSRKRGVPSDQVLEQSNLVDDLDLDSLELADMALEWETRYEVDVPDDKLFGVDTVGDVITLVLSATKQ